ncbi:acyltransferase domain-containing protein [Toxoplasma gondii ME49]|uniref:Acyltransferase domain-containing protein n=1 Tax=Toxoplasma gondii (strain ATCC 50611 / Me49) TaxID=508771 RepID=S8G9N0_TOXGM|nr:acyltransferase domain-containing protein [Toxoplasma gondii ME49]EPT28460.1 acyltransferase domain-containing protein [Toxoplasma gondii ME49]|eukprot:XP_002365757.2 acyltransferase domain-containing protein [Toxoplasma gondii ME49]
MYTNRNEKRPIPLHRRPRMRNGSISCGAPQVVCPGSRSCETVRDKGCRCSPSFLRLQNKTRSDSPSCHTVKNPFLFLSLFPRHARAFISGSSACQEGVLRFGNIADPQPLAVRTAPPSNGLCAQFLVRSFLAMLFFLARLQLSESSILSPPSPVVSVQTLGVLPLSVFLLVSLPSSSPALSRPLIAEAVSLPFENGHFQPSAAALTRLSLWTPKTGPTASSSPSDFQYRPSPVPSALLSRQASVASHGDFSTLSEDASFSSSSVCSSPSPSCLSPAHICVKGRSTPALVKDANLLRRLRSSLSISPPLPFSVPDFSLSTSSAPSPPVRSPVAFVSPSASHSAAAFFTDLPRPRQTFSVSSTVWPSPSSPVALSLSPLSPLSHLRASASSEAPPAWLPYGLPERLPGSLGRSTSAEAFQKAKEYFQRLLEKGDLTPAWDERPTEQEGGGRTAAENASPRLTEQHRRVFSEFAEIYAREAVKSGLLTAQEYIDIFASIWQLAWKYAGYSFKPYHQALRSPFDFAEWSKKVWRPLVSLPMSKIVVPSPSASPAFASPLGRINERLAAGENVVFLSNHQTEPDPQVIKLVLDHLGETALANKMVFVAGHKVREDRLSTPFSLACNLLCVHSKKHLTHPELSAEEKHEKQCENLAAMAALQQLLEEGGSVIWVAPSGGRDRQDDNGVFSQPDPFDVKTVQMFRLLAKKIRHGSRGTLTHFYPMALFTALICPPPKQVEASLGEARSCAFSPVGVAVGESIADSDDQSHEEFARKAEAETKRLYKLITAHFE